MPHWSPYTIFSGKHPTKQRLYRIHYPQIALLPHPHQFISATSTAKWYQCFRIMRYNLFCRVARVKLSTTLFIRSKQGVKVHRQVLGIYHKGQFDIVNFLTSFSYTMCYLQLIYFEKKSCLDDQNKYVWCLIGVILCKLEMICKLSY